MALPPGWKPKKFKDYCPGKHITIAWSYDDTHYYLDNGEEFIDFPRTTDGWESLCDELKKMEV